MDGVAFEFSLTSNRELVENATDEAIESALEAIGFQAEGYAKPLTPSDTGNLRNSITHVVQMGDDDGDAVYIGTNVEYAPYVEFGTGKFADNGQGRQTPWVYYDEKLQRFVYTHGREPAHMIRDALEKHADEYKSMVEEYLSEAFAE